MSDKVKFSFNALEGSLELEGSEEFVSKTLEEMKPYLDEMTEAAKGSRPHSIPNPPPSPVSNEVSVPAPSTDTSTSDTQQAHGEATPSAPKSSGIEAYPHTFAELDNHLHVVAKIPGDSTKQKMKNVALLYCLGMELMGEDTAQSEAIRITCEEHGCLDSGNFAKSFREKKLFITSGDRKKTVRLTYAGREAAKKLAESIEDDANH